MPLDASIVKLPHKSGHDVTIASTVQVLGSLETRSSEDGRVPDCLCSVDGAVIDHVLNGRINLLKIEPLSDGNSFRTAPVAP
jgi:hypothetical protein